MLSKYFNLGCVHTCCLGLLILLVQTKKENDTFNRNKPCLNAPSEHVFISSYSMLTYLLGVGSHRGL